MGCHRQTNSQPLPRRPCWITELFLPTEFLTLKATTKKRFTYLTPQGGKSSNKNPKYGFNASQGSVFFTFHPPSRGPQCGAIWITPLSPDDGSSLVHILKQILYFLFLFYFLCLPFVTPRRSEWTGSISSALGDRWGGGNTGVSRTRVGCVVVSFTAQHLFLIPPILCCCFWLGGRRKMWDMGYEDEHLLVRHYPWVNNPLRAWAQCRRPQEPITFFLGTGDETARASIDLVCLFWLGSY